MSWVKQGNFSAQHEVLGGVSVDQRTVDSVGSRWVTGEHESIASSVSVAGIPVSAQYCTLVAGRFRRIGALVS